MEIRNGLHFFVHPSSEADIPYRNIFLSSTPSKRGSRRILHPVSPDIPISDGTFCPSGNKRFIPDGLLNKNILSGKSTSFPDGLLNYHSISEM